MTFAYPILAIVAIISFFAYLVIFASLQKKRKSLLAKFAALALLPSLESNVSRFKVWLKGVCISLAIMFILLALARPQWGYKWEEQKQLGLDIVFALDTSKSMLAEDIKPNRLERSKLAISDILERLEGDRVGLVAFSGQAFLQCPVTLDYGAFKMSLEALDTNIIQRGGTNIAAAIDEADAALANTKNQKIIILISDGEELESSGISRAEKISKEENAKIFTLGVGSTSGEPIPVRDSRGNLTFLKDENGKLVSSILNEALLKKVAEATGGFYASLAENGMDEIFENGISKESKSELSSKMKKIAIERFQIPLAIAIALLVFELILGTRRIFAKKGILKTSSIVALLFLIFILPNNADAQSSPDSKDFFNLGVEAFNQKDFKKAKENFYASAASSYDLNMHSKAYYNIGNADYESAKIEFSKIPSPTEAQQKAMQSIAQAESAISQANPVLQKGLQTLKNSGEEALKEKSLQDQLKQSLQTCEQSKKTIEEDSKTQSKIQSEIKNVFSLTLLSEKNYENAVELNPENKQASENLNASKKAVENLNTLEKQFEEIKKGQNQYAENLQKLIEELKKLIRDEDNKNQDNKQNQDQQKNQDKNQEQNQDNKQDNNQDNNKQNQDNKQDSQDNKQNKDNKKDSSDKQNQDNKQSQPDNKNEENKSEKNEQNAEQNKQDSAQDKDDSKKQNPQSQDSSKQDEKQNEQASQSDAAQDKKDEKKSEENAAKPEEKQVQESPEAKAQEAQKNTDEQNQDFRAAEGVMTRREASQVLDSMKDNEKKLPFSGYGTQRRRYEDKNYKDW